jgi:hypothetical protein
MHDAFQTEAAAFSHGPGAKVLLIGDEFDALCSKYI